MKGVTYMSIALALGLVVGGMDPYGVLGVEEGSSISEIKRAYRRLSLKYHPDNGGVGSACVEEAGGLDEVGTGYDTVESDEDSVTTCTASWGDVDESDAFRRITEAYDVLKEGTTRRLYDKYGQEWSSMQEYLSKADALGLVEIYDDDRNTDSQNGQKRRLITILHDDNWKHHLVPETREQHSAGEREVWEDNYWAVIFYHPEVRECIKNKARYHQIASNMAKTGEKVRFGAINCAMSDNLCTRFGIDTYDTILVFDQHQMSTKYLNYYHWDLEPEMLPTITDWIEKKNKLPVVLNGDDHLAWWLSHNEQGATGDATPPGTDAAASVIIHFTRTCRPCQEIVRYIESMDHASRSVKHILVDCTTGQCDAPYYPYIQLMSPKTRTQEELGNTKNTDQLVPIDYHFKRHPIELILNLISTIYSPSD